jgi:hypothetical protein
MITVTVTSMNMIIMGVIIRMGIITMMTTITHTDMTINMRTDTTTTMRIRLRRLRRSPVKPCWSKPYRFLVKA